MSREESPPEAESLPGFPRTLTERLGRSRPIKRAAFVVLALFGVVFVFIAITSIDPLVGDSSTNPYPAQESVILKDDPANRIRFESQRGLSLHSFDVWVARTPAERYQGLSGTTREQLPEDAGLLFVYEEEAERSIVMRDMNYPLNVIFIAADGTVTTVHEADIEPGDTSEEELRRYTGRAKYILEVPQGMASQFSIIPGVRATIAKEPSK